ncbi:beta-lactamase family protein [Arsenicicoccus piscis]|uniref:Serine hydrolase n=1 Tax=Arsenicicoccus piscis TaxID=673954 RepID=A0ABQ6HTF2_9MICO|nr:serine hydrolase domain-containing protein [Arsenicicoccus piscis]MCH8626758.1 beta-lactamase family protein [Arsenicicoccus piscis]GMA21442.1 serine hydrolase [Arsenicicoccus piscis]
MKRSAAHRTIAAGTVVGLSVTLATTLTAPAVAAAASAPTVTETSLTGKRPVDQPLQDLLDTMVAGQGVGAVGAVQRGQATWSSAAGVRRAGTTQAARAGDAFRVGSITKTMVATVAMQLVDERRWTLQTRVDEVLPGLLPGHGDVTLEQLLSHRSGLPEFLLGVAEEQQAAGLSVDEAYAQSYTDQHLVRLALAQKWGAKPGTAFSYSNTNYVVVGLMIEKITGAPMKKVLRQRVFNKAHMPHSTFAVDARTPRRMLGEHWVDKTVHPFVQDASVFSSAGAVISTTADLNAFTGALFTGRLTSKGSLNQMKTARSQTPLRYGLGLYSMPDPCAPKGSKRMVYGHNGATFGTLASVVSTPDGRTRAAAGVTGRIFPPGDVTKQPYGEDFTLPALKLMCRQTSPPAAPLSAGR